MNFWAPFPFARITVFFIVGIFCGHYLPEYIILTPGEMLIAVPFFCILAVLALRTNFLKSDLFGGLAILLIIVMGSFYMVMFTGQVASIPKTTSGYHGVVVSNPEIKGRFSRQVVEISHLITEDSAHETEFKLQLYINKESNSEEIRYGDYLVIKGTPDRIRSPQNPGEFDFASFWSKKLIYHQDFVNPDQVKVIKNDPPSTILNLSYRMRDRFVGYLSQAIDGPRELAIAKALIIGAKNSIDNDVRSAYAAAGAMHVLAVSGLHVGILYLFILYLFKPVKKYRFAGVYIGVTSLVILWFYALITGFSPSVQRSVVMFSIFILGNMLDRQRNIYNSLAFSAFILLLINPYMIFDVGFQLSYLAVFGIIFLQPKIFQIWSPDHYLVTKLWEISSVSIAAQLGTFPLGLFYFHQFPVLFLLSNFVVIPAAFLVMLLGILTLITASMGLSVFNLLGDLIYAVLWLMNEAVIFIEGIHFSVIDGVDISVLQLICLYLFIIGGIRFLLAKKFRMLPYSILMIAIFSLIEIEEAHSRAGKKEVVFFDLSGASAVDFRNGFTTTLYLQGGDSTNIVSYTVGPSRLAAGLSAESFTTRNFDDWSASDHGFQVKVWNGLTFVRLKESFDDVNVRGSFCVDYLIISDNAVHDLNVLTSSFSFKKLIIDSSNGFKLSNQLKLQASSLKLPVHVTRIDGALVIDI